MPPEGSRLRRRRRCSSARSLAWPAAHTRHLKGPVPRGQESRATVTLRPAFACVSWCSSTSGVPCSPPKPLRPWRPRRLGHGAPDQEPERRRGLRPFLEEGRAAPAARRSIRSPCQSQRRLTRSLTKVGQEDRPVALAGAAVSREAIACLPVSVVNRRPVDAEVSENARWNSWMTFGWRHRDEAVWPISMLGRPRFEPATRP